MRSRLTVFISIGLVAAAALIVGVVTAAGAGSPAALPAVTAPELMTEMAAARGQLPALSGEVSWRNDLFGDLSAAEGIAEDSVPSPFIGSGSGRIWMSEDGVRVEAQGRRGDQLAGVSKATRTAWTYDATTDTARAWVMPGGDPAGEPLPSPSASVMTPRAIGAFLTRLAPYATLDIAGQGTVAGRQVYLLRMTPAAGDTALGAVQVSVDGETMVPLRLEVFAKGAASAVLRFGFDSISYGPVDATLYEFTPPAGADVTTKLADPSQAKGEDGGAGYGAWSGAGEDEAARKKLARRALLTIDEAQGLVDHRIATARDTGSRPFRWAYVLESGMPLTALGGPVFGSASLGNGDEQGSGSQAAGEASSASVLLYGSGFGAIALAQTKTTPELEEQLAQLPLLNGAAGASEGAAGDGDAPVRSLITPLGGVYVWQQGGTTLVAGGMVPAADLEAFVDSVR